MPNDSIREVRASNASQSAMASPTTETPAPSAVWRVCHVITGDCKRCPPVEEHDGDGYVRACYLHGEECINTVETGNPWRKTGEVREPFVALSAAPASAPSQGGNGWRPEDARQGEDFALWCVMLYPGSRISDIGIGGVRVQVPNDALSTSWAFANLPTPPATEGE